MVTAPSLAVGSFKKIFFEGLAAATCLYDAWSPCYSTDAMVHVRALQRPELR